jgi:hypothetical protein
VRTKGVSPGQTLIVASITGEMSMRLIVRPR